MGNKYMRKCSISLPSGKCKSKFNSDSNSLQSEWLSSRKLKRTTITNNKLWLG
jgi:hypothetical protein